jgi:hypothetical protein
MYIYEICELLLNNCIGGDIKSYDKYEEESKKVIKNTFEYYNLIYQFNHYIDLACNINNQILLFKMIDTEILNNKEENYKVAFFAAASNDNWLIMEKILDMGYIPPNSIFIHLCLVGKSHLIKKLHKRVDFTVIDNIQEIYNVSPNTDYTALISYGSKFPGWEKYKSILIIILALYTCDDIAKNICNYII